ncbi:MAG TPA: hypothetical protein VE326_11330 [Candidatus Binatia bacterium]|nr:hypothetical protein [Candidatus Binatia bacterium]
MSLAAVGPAGGGHLDGLCVTVRRERRKKHKRARPQVGFTLHEATCGYVARAGDGNVMPAPATPYPNTVDCTYCKPTGKHKLTYVDLPDGTVEAACSCGSASAVAGTRGAAYLRLLRSHEEIRTRPPRPAQKATRKSTTTTVTTTTVTTTDGRRRGRHNGDHVVRLDFSTLPSGQVLVTCTGCGESADGPTRNAAKLRMWRMHRRAKDVSISDS